MQRKLQETCFWGIKILGSGFLPQAGISQEQFKAMRSWQKSSPSSSMQEAPFSIRGKPFSVSPFWNPKYNLLNPITQVAHKHKLHVEHVTCKIYWVRSTASFFSWRSRVSLSFTVMILTSPRRSSLRPRGRFRTHTLIFSLSVHGVSFSEVLDLQQNCSFTL